MGTQTTRLDNNGEIATGPTEAQPVETEIAGRKLKMKPPVAPTEAHPLGGSSIGEPLQKTIEQPAGFGQEEVQQHMPDFLKEEQRQVEPTADQEEIEAPAEARMDEAVRLLSTRLAQARNRGDQDLAQNIQATLDELISVSEVKKIYRAKDEHPTLQKLRQQLGVQKIQPVTVEWAGFVWHFAPAPSPVWSWATAVGAATPLAFYDLKISTNLVGLDNVPIYEVLGVDLINRYNIPGAEDADPIEVPAFQKFCDSCGTEVKIEATKCTVCNSGLDPFNMPLALRLYCAEKFHNYLQEKFGPYEELDQLVALMNEKMLDRFADREKLYPFLKASSEAETTTT